MSDVFAVRCPSAGCRKFMLVEAADRGNIVPCLICKTGILIPAAFTAAPPAPKPPPAAPAAPKSGYDFSPPK